MSIQRYTYSEFETIEESAKGEYVLWADVEDRVLILEKVAREHGNNLLSARARIAELERKAISDFTKIEAWKAQAVKLEDLLNHKPTDGDLAKWAEDDRAKSKRIAELEAQHLATQRALVDSAHLVWYNGTGTTYDELFDAHMQAITAARVSVAQADGKEAV